jgi:hypothetical protein
MNTKTHMTCAKPSMLIQGKQEQGWPKINRKVYNIVQPYCSQIPCINDIYDIKFNKDDRDKFTYALRKTDTTTPSPDNVNKLDIDTSNEFFENDEKELSIIDNSDNDNQPCQEVKSKYKTKYTDSTTSMISKKYRNCRQVTFKSGINNIF